MIKKEINLFFTALMFYTRIPCPSWITHEEDALNKSTKYFPLIGWIVGGICAAVLYGSAQILPLEIAVVLSTISGILVTGAFHEDGFMDTCDAFGGGWTKEKILEIMKDSRMGAFGVLGMICLMALKIYALIYLATFSLETTCILLVCIHASSRFTAILLRLGLDYVRENDDAKAKPIAKQTELSGYLLSFIFTLLPFVFLAKIELLWILIPLFSILIYLTYYFKKWIGGYTGDCLGCTQQVAEVCFYLTVLIVWKSY
jgi:adenosylcobinamide-GDP ribazoletransferase